MSKINIRILTLLAFIMLVHPAVHGQDESLALGNLVPSKLLLPDNGGWREVYAYEDMSFNIVHHVLQESYRPPKGIRHVYIPGNSINKTDRLIMRYEIGNDIITLSQSLCIMAVILERQNQDMQLSTNDITTIMNHLFNLPQKDKVQAVATVVSNNATAGTIEITTTTNPPAWLNSLRWWHDAGRLGFYFLKRRDGPSSTEPMMGYRFNQRWFSHSLNANDVPIYCNNWPIVIKAKSETNSVAEMAHAPVSIHGMANNNSGLPYHGNDGSGVASRHSTNGVPERGDSMGPHESPASGRMPRAATNAAPDQAQ